jgi:RimJ/RimL family protein N-acetyltransferase
MWAPPSLASPRLNLSKVGEGDRIDILDGYAWDPEVTRYLTWTPRTDVGQVDEFIADRLRRWETGESFTWVLRLEASNELVGMVEARVDSHRIELGYVVVRRFWGNGFATEAVRAVVDWAAAEPAVKCVWGYTDVDNRASIRVLEKASLSRAGLLEGWAVHPNIAPTPRDCYIYSRRFD